MIKPWIHPITQTKINIHGGMSDAVKKMVEAGVDKSAIPELMGGTCKPRSTFEYMVQVIEENQGKGAGNDDDADECDGQEQQQQQQQGNEVSSEPDKVADDMGHLAVV